MNSIQIWKDKIVLRTSTDSLPKADLLPYAKFNEKFNGFLLSFSAQNLRRIHAQYGQIPVKGDRSPIDNLKKKLSYLKGMTDLVGRIKLGDFDDTKIDYKLPPLGLYQHRLALFLSMTPSAPLFADCGCIAGDSQIEFSLQSGRGKKSISELYSLPEHSEIKVISFKGNSFGLHPIRKIIQSGIKIVWELKLSNGSSIKATPDHEILTDDGWVELKDLNLDSKVKLGNRGFHGFSTVTSLTPLKEEMTYDIICEDPYRNFVANNIVVHNCGKTYSVLTSTEHQIKNKTIATGKTLVCGKLATLETGWQEDAEKFTDLKVVTLWQSSQYKKKEKILKKLDEPADIYLINHDGLRVFEKELSAKKFDKVVVDESTILKIFKGEHSRMKGGAFGKSLMKVARHANWRVVMSGTPAPNTIEDLWGQMHFLDPEGFLLEGSIHDFRNRYMQEMFFGKLARDDDGNVIHGVPADKDTPSTWIPKKGSRIQVGSKVNPLVYRIKIRDVIKDLPERTIQTRKVVMTKDQAKHYKEMEDALATRIDDEYVSVPNRLAELMKLRQITGGFLIDQKKVVHPLKQNPKMEALDSLVVDEIDVDHKVVIYAEYRYEIETIQSRYKEYGAVSVYGGNNSKTNLKAIKDFIHDPEIRVIVLHPKSAAHGITFTVAHYLIFYSISHSAEDNYQAIKRIERAGQKNAMFVYYLLAKGFIDEKIYAVVKTKLRNQDTLIDQNNIDKSLLKDWRSGGH